MVAFVIESKSHDLMPKSLLPFLVLLAVLAACNKYVDFTPAPQPAEGLAREALSPEASQLTDTLFTDAQKPDTLTSLEGVVLILPGNCLEKCTDSTACIPCRGLVQVVMRVLFSKRDILFLGKPTVTATQLLETGGQVFLNITQDGVPLRFRPGTYYILKIPAGRTQAEASRMEYYAATLSTGWYRQGPLASRDQAYYTIHSALTNGWLSPAYAYATGPANVHITINAETKELAADSTHVFVVPGDVHAVVGAERLAGRFIPTSFLPVNRKATLVAIGENNEVWSLSAEQVTTGPDLQLRVPFTIVTPRQAYEQLETLN